MEQHYLAVIEKFVKSVLYDLALQGFNAGMESVKTQLVTEHDRALFGQVEPHMAELAQGWVEHCIEAQLMLFEWVKTGSEGQTPLIEERYQDEEMQTLSFRQVLEIVRQDVMEKPNVAAFREHIKEALEKGFLTVLRQIGLKKMLSSTWRVGEVLLSVPRFKPHPN